jgi:hypothetical protein
MEMAKCDKQIRLMRTLAINRINCEILNQYDTANQLMNEYLMKRDNVQEL